MSNKIKHNKESKKKPLMTAKEKKAAKRDKKLSDNSPSLFKNNA